MEYPRVFFYWPGVRPPPSNLFEGGIKLIKKPQKGLKTFNIQGGEGCQKFEGTPT